jgi:DNA modification methylase
LLVSLDRKIVSNSLEEALAQTDLEALREVVAGLKQAIAATNGRGNATASALEPEAVSLRRDVLESELDQILDSQTIDRARYYIRRLARGIAEQKTAAVNDINLNRWKEYPEILTDSLWVLPKRDTTGAHLGWYWGNFIPQIPHQLMLRYTKAGEWVLDPFAGSGTTLIECNRLGRHGIGIELNPEVAEKARELIARQPSQAGATSTLIAGDSRTIDLRNELAKAGTSSVQLVVMHPPYHDIIGFSDDERDLSNAKGAEAFLQMFAEVVDNMSPLLDRRRYLAVVIGDKYEAGEWMPLGFHCMNEVLKRDYTLKSIIVKNFDETRAKRDQKQLWRYRALVGGFYIFKHEYILLFRKK